MGHLLYGSSLLGSYLTFPLPILQECRTFEIRLHCNDHSWCSPAMCVCRCQFWVWNWHIVFFTHGMCSSCTRCWFLYWRIVPRIWSCNIGNSAGICLLDVVEGRTLLQLDFSYSLIPRPSVPCIYCTWEWVQCIMHNGSKAFTALLHVLSLWNYQI